MKKRMLMLRGKSLRGDATFKVSKRFVDQGMRSLKAIYSVMNEVRWQGTNTTTTHSDCYVSIESWRHVTPQPPHTYEPW